MTGFVVLSSSAVESVDLLVSVIYLVFPVFSLVVFVEVIKHFRPGKKGKEESSF